MGKTIILLAILAVALGALGWAAIKFWFFIRAESDLERQSNLEIKIDAQDALAELDAATRRFNKRKSK